MTGTVLGLVNVRRLDSLSDPLDFRFSCIVAFYLWRLQGPFISTRMRNCPSNAGLFRAEFYIADRVYAAITVPTCGNRTPEDVNDGQKVSWPNVWADRIMTWVATSRSWQTDPSTFKVSGDCSCVWLYTRKLLILITCCLIVFFFFG